MAFLRNLKTLESFKSPNYRWYFSGLAGQWAGASMQMVAQALLIYRLSNSAVILGLLALANAIPQVVLSLFAGVLADRFPKKHLIQISQAVGVINALGIGIALTSGYMSSEHTGSWWIIVVAGFLQGAFSTLATPARYAIIPELVGKDRVMNALSLSTMAQNVFQFVGPALGGFLIDTFNFQTIYFIMSGFGILAMICTGFLPATVAVQTKSRNVLKDIKEGLKYTWSHKTVFFVVGFVVMGVIIATPSGAMLSIFTDDILHVGATGLGVLQSASGIGALAATLVLASVPGKRRGWIMIASGLGMGLSLLIFAFSRFWPLSIIMMVLFGISKSGHITPGITLMQTYTDREYLGRVQSIPSVSMGIGGVAAFFVGILAESIGVQWATGGFAMIMVVISALAILGLTRLRNLE